MIDDGRVELETNDLVQLRKDFRDLVNAMVDGNTQHEDDRKESKKELDAVKLYILFLKKRGITELTS